MSSVKKKIAIVAGRVSNLHRFDCFAHLGTDYQVKLLTLDYEKVLSGYSGSLRQIIFEEKSDMAGYMPGLENHLQGQDLIICYESFQLSSFQASRIAQRSATPMWIISDDPKPFRYIEYRNIRSIQSDVANHASQFLVGSEASRAALITEGIKQDHLQYIPISVDCPPLSEVVRLRKKFRSYVGLADNKIVVTLESPLDENGYALELIKALKLACEIRPAVKESLVILIVGDGPQSRDLKCLAYDSELVRNIMFMHQDSAKLTHDIFGATDIYVVNPKPDESQPYFAPARALAAAAWGAIPMGLNDQTVRSLFGGRQIGIEDPSFQSAAMRLIEISQQAATITDRSNELMEHVCLHHNASTVASGCLMPVLENFVQLRRDSEPSLTAKSDLASSEVPDSNERLERYSEQLSTLPDQDFAQRSRIEASKAHIFTERRLFDQAIDSYTAAINLDSGNVDALTGLGNLSYQTQSYEEAMKFFKRALAIAPDSAAACAGLGMVYSKLGLHNDAIFWFEKSIVHGDHRPGILTMMVQSCLESKSPDQALNVLERVEELVGSLETTQMAIARLHVKIGNGEQGREIMRKVLARG